MSSDLWAAAIHIVLAAHPRVYHIGADNRTVFCNLWANSFHKHIEIAQCILFSGDVVPLGTCWVGHFANVYDCQKPVSAGVSLSFELPAAALYIDFVAKFGRQ